MNREGNTRAGMRKGKAQRGANHRGANCYSTGNTSRNKSGLCRREMSVGSFWEEDRSYQAESVVGNEKRSTSPTLQMLKEQADRLTKALQQIETQIKALNSDGSIK